MRIELTSPCCLHLGFVRTNDGALCELGLALQHPPVQLTAWPASQLIVSGARAEVAYDYAVALNLTSEIEIELAIPANMGLSSSEMMRACMKRLASIWRDAPQTFHMTLAEGAAYQGGLLLINDDGLVQERTEIAHVNEDDDWVFVLALPKEPDDLPETYEADQRLALQRAASRLPDLGAQVARLFSAVKRDDFNAFTDALSGIHAANEAALAADGHPIELNDQERDVLGFMRANDTAFAGRALTGLALFGLIKGGKPSRTLRKALTDHLGYFGPLVMASICDNHGAHIKEI
jgi:predicted sugar kinase